MDYSYSAGPDFLARGRAQGGVRREIPTGQDQPNRRLDIGDGVELRPKT